MDRLSVYDAFHLSEAELPGFVHTLPIHPLEHVVAADNQQCLLIISYDRHTDSRVVEDVPRMPAYVTHGNVTIITGKAEAPVTVGFGGACFVETFDGKEFSALHPDMKEEGALFEQAGRLPIWRKLLHPSLRKRVKGIVLDESWRYTDSFMSIILSPEQAQGALDVVREWKENPPSYRVLADENDGENCHRFAAAVMRGASVIPPEWWGWGDCPPLDARILEWKSGYGLEWDGLWLLQSCNVTRDMHHRRKNRPMARPHDHRHAARARRPSLQQAYG